MRKYYHIPKDQKIPEKVMLFRVVAAVLAVAICLAGISLSAYAWFSAEIFSSRTQLTAATFDVNVTVTNNGTEVAANANGTYTLAAGSTYTVRLEKLGDASTGFCIVIADFGSVQTEYHTQQIGQDGQNSKQVLTFEFKVISGVAVKILPQLGTSVLYGQEHSPYYIKDISIKELPASEILHLIPTTAPTTTPTTAPTTAPTTVPTTVPTTAPTTEPTTAPTTVPTTVPTTEPTTVPTTEPTTVPTTEPTTVPTTAPTTVPTTAPATVPTTAPTTVPTTAPTTVPTTAPTTVPTTAPTTAPSTEPTTVESNH